MSMDKECYEQLKNNDSARLQLWFEISSEMTSHKLWHELDKESQETVEKILRYVIVEGWND